MTEIVDIARASREMFPEPMSLEQIMIAMGVYGDLARIARDRYLDEARVDLTRELGNVIVSCARVCGGGVLIPEDGGDEDATRMGGWRATWNNGNGDQHPICPF